MFGCIRRTSKRTTTVFKKFPGSGHVSTYASTGRSPLLPTRLQGKPEALDQGARSPEAGGRTGVVGAGVEQKVALSRQPDAQLSIASHPCYAFKNASHPEAFFGFQQTGGSAASR